MLRIKGYREDETVKIEVIDDGAGMDEELITRILSKTSNFKKNSDFGLYSVNSRLKLLYGDKYGIKIESKVNVYTKVTVILPVVLP